MGEGIRKLGIDIIGEAPWGTHFCQFYQTKEDLIDILVPYFKAGLENNEFCVWVTSEPLIEKEAKKAMRNAVPVFDQYLKRGQIEIIPHTQWYLKDGTFNLQRVLNAWIDKLDQALSKGYDGMRVTGNTAWLEKRDWRSFTDYEEEINNTIGKYPMIAICTYSLDKCGASEIIDVVKNHQFAVIRREGKWELIKGSERVEAALRISAEQWHSTFDSISDAVALMDLEGKFLKCNTAMTKLLGKPVGEIIGRTCWELVHGTSEPIEGCPVVRMRKTHKRETLVLPIGERWFDVTVDPLLDKDRNLVGAVHIISDITERKHMDERIKASLKDKEVLLKEIHHRVRNNLQIVSSLLDMSSRRTHDRQATNLFRDARNKIYTMALIHSQLYRSDRFDRIDIGSHIRQLVDYLSQVYVTQKGLITPVIERFNVYLSVTQAIPCALVLNEVISNAFKHAFKEGQKGTIEISIQKSADDTIFIRVKDDGIGMPGEIDIYTADSLGLKLIRNLVQEQLRGKIQVERINGTEILIEFKILEEEVRHA